MTAYITQLKFDSNYDREDYGDRTRSGRLTISFEIHGETDDPADMERLRTVLGTTRGELFELFKPPAPPKVESIDLGGLSIDKASLPSQPVIVMAGEPGYFTPTRTPHDALCSCTECLNASRELLPEDQPIIEVWPFQNAARNWEPTAWLEYGGIRIALPLTFLSTVFMGPETIRNPCYTDAMSVLKTAVDEIGRRMWCEIDDRENRKSP